MAYKTITGKVVQRNFNDLSIVLNVCESLAVVNFAIKLESQANKYEYPLPHTNNVVTLKNIKQILESRDNETTICYYLATSTTDIQILADNYEEEDNTLDDFAAVADMLNASSDIDMLKLTEIYQLTEEHVKVYIGLCNSLPNINPKDIVFKWKHVTISLFRILFQVGIINKLSLSQSCLLMDKKRQYIINNATTVGRIGELNAKTKQQLDNNHDIAAYFGNKQSKTNECLIGVLTCRLGKVYIEDGTTAISLHINCDKNSDILEFCNALVVILQYHNICEIYYDGIAECLFVDVRNMRILSKLGVGEFFSELKCNQPAFVMSTDEIDFVGCDYYQYKFVIEAIASISKVYQQNEVEVWLLIEMFKDPTHKEACLLALSEEYLSTVSFLDIDRTYVLYTPKQLNEAGYNPHIKRFSNKLECFKLTSKGSYFLPTECCNPHNQHAPTTTLRLPTNTQNTLNVRARLMEHYLNASDTHRKVPECSHPVGMLANTFEHKLVLLFEDNTQKSIYLTHWEEKQTPAGLHPNVMLLITQATYNGRYLSANIFTRVKVVGVGNELSKYVTANFNAENKEIIEYNSILKHAALNIKYFMFIRTKVYVIGFEGKVNFSLKELMFKFKVLDDQGLIDLQCSKFSLLYKLMEIEDEDEIQDLDYYGVYKDEVDLSNIDEILENQNIKENAPFFYFWVQHVYYKLNYCIISLDILCKKKLNGVWTIQDVFKVN